MQLSCGKCACHCENPHYQLIVRRLARICVGRHSFVLFAKIFSKSVEFLYEELSGLLAWYKFMIMLKKAFSCNEAISRAQTLKSRLLLIVFFMQIEFKLHECQPLWLCIQRRGYSLHFVLNVTNIEDFLSIKEITLSTNSPTCSQLLKFAALWQ